LKYRAYREYIGARYFISHISELGLIPYKAMHKQTILFFLIIITLLGMPLKADAQIKEAVQFATLSPTILVIYSDLESYQKHHYTLSTLGYMGSYIITESIWKSALIALTLGVSKELIYDGLLGRGDPLWDDMKWNTLGVAQGVVFTVSLSF